MTQFPVQEVTLLLGDLAVGDVAEDYPKTIAECEQPIGHPASAKYHRLDFRPDGFPAYHRLKKELAELCFVRAGEYFPQDAAEDILWPATKMPRRLVIEQDDAPIAIDGIKALADAVQNRRKAGLGVERSDLFGNEGFRVGNIQKSTGGGWDFFPRYREQVTQANSAARNFSSASCPAMTACFIGGMARACWTFLGQALHLNIVGDIASTRDGSVS